ncbi:MAG: hypothetical protein PVH88_17115 [Ignavibacteria bacterium]
MRKYVFGFLLIFAMFVFNNSLNAAYYRYDVSADPGEIIGNGNGATLDEAHAHWVTVTGQTWSTGDAVAQAVAYDTDTDYPAPHISLESRYDAGTRRDSDYGFCDGSIRAYVFCYAGDGMSCAYVTVSW